MSAEAKAIERRKGKTKKRRFNFSSIKKSIKGVSVSVNKRLDDRQEHIMKRKENQLEKLKEKKQKISRKRCKKTARKKLDAEIKTLKKEVTLRGRARTFIDKEIKAAKKRSRKKKK